MRLRFTEYVMRFVRLAFRYEEETTGSTKFGFPSQPFIEMPGQNPQLGSGLSFNDEASCWKDLVANAHRIEAWRKTSSYQYLVTVGLPHFTVSWCFLTLTRTTLNTKLIAPSKASM